MAVGTVTMINAWKTREKRVGMVIDDHDRAQKPQKFQAIMKSPRKGGGGVQDEKSPETQRTARPIMVTNRQNDEKPRETEQRQCP